MVRANFERGGGGCFLGQPTRHLPGLPQTLLIGAQNLAWALINNPAFLFNR
jgi:hypothetical protein